MPPDPEPKKLFDVAKPGKTLPSASSRPLITGRHDLLQDPMLRTSEAAKDESDESPAEAKTKPEAKPDAKIPTAKHWPPAAEASPIQAVDKPEVQPAEPPDQESEAKEDKSEPDEVTHPTPPKTTAANDDSLYDEVIQQKVYFAPVGPQHNKHPARSWLIITLIVLITGLLIADLLIDNGTIKTSIQPPIQIFHNNRQP